ncbi:hypothetical protein BJ508DRAFT_332390 [Ascobolus immersus RN42]|uniref:Uncharacterized protein n=1 Tax=Ascobolus immersus RN42 TaxID=1160509 RepID=A0A3N4HQC9_ASCIM|nr:hypothetical protein BJ508DRAFT_332390 [Ascobolus immersus RN42]
MAGMGQHTVGQHFNQAAELPAHLTGSQQYLGLGQGVNTTVTGQDDFWQGAGYTPLRDPGSLYPTGFDNLGSFPTQNRESEFLPQHAFYHDLSPNQGFELINQLQPVQDSLYHSYQQGSSNTGFDVATNPNSQAGSSSLRGSVQQQTGGQVGVSQPVTGLVVLTSEDTGQDPSVPNYPEWETKIDIGTPSYKYVYRKDWWYQVDIQKKLYTRLTKGGNINTVNKTLTKVICQCGIPMLWRSWETKSHSGIETQRNPAELEQPPPLCTGPAKPAPRNADGSILTGSQSIRVVNGKEQPFQACEMCGFYIPTKKLSKHREFCATSDYGNRLPVLLTLKEQLEPPAPKPKHHDIAFMIVGWDTDIKLAVLKGEPRSASDLPTVLDISEFIIWDGIVARDPGTPYKIMYRKSWWAPVSSGATRTLFTTSRIKIQEKQNIVVLCVCGCCWAWDGWEDKHTEISGRLGKAVTPSKFPCSSTAERAPMGKDGKLDPKLVTIGRMLPGEVKERKFKACSICHFYIPVEGGNSPKHEKICQSLDFGRFLPILIQQKAKHPDLRCAVLGHKTEVSPPPKVAAK